MDERYAIPDHLSRRVPRTHAVRLALSDIIDSTVLADYLFLEQWELTPAPGAAGALRFSQIRRANPELAAAVRLEIAAS